MKIAIEVATQEVEKWLDYKKISDNKRGVREENIKALIEGVSEGILVLNEDFSFTHTLKFQIEGELPITKLSYKPRLKVASVHNHMQGVKASDGDGRVCAYVAALSSQPKEVIKHLDTEDYAIATAVAVFFL
jgi:hypothetical protein